jgi:hypothetical protein
VQALVKCHVDNSISKWWGHCNSFKDALDECFKVPTSSSTGHRTAFQQFQTRRGDAQITTSPVYADEAHEPWAHGAPSPSSAKHIAEVNSHAELFFRDCIALKRL